jgi:hypothetical protein
LRGTGEVQKRQDAPCRAAARSPSRRPPSSAPPLQNTHCIRNSVNYEDHQPCKASNNVTAPPASEGSAGSETTNWQFLTEAMFARPLKSTRQADSGSYLGGTQQPDRDKLQSYKRSLHHHKPPILPRPGQFRARWAAIKEYSLGSALVQHEGGLGVHLVLLVGLTDLLEGLYNVVHHPALRNADRRYVAAVRAVPAKCERVSSASLSDARPTRSR